MNIDAIDKTLDSAIALLMYGSGAWLACALPTFIVTRSNTRSKETVRHQSSQVDTTAAEVGSISIEVSPEVLPVEPEQPSVLPEIICEPVNWKKWKVGDLRKANITRVCGVRVSPIGSKRKLLKADLIAQYEQNLKRMTSARPDLTVQSEKIA